MKITELNKEQLQQVKQDYYCKNNDYVSYYELASIDDLVSDEEVYEEYANTYFVEDDFF